MRRAVEETQDMIETREAMLDLGSIEAKLPEQTKPVRLAFPCVFDDKLTVFVDAEPETLERTLKTEAIIDCNTDQEGLDIWMGYVDEASNTIMRQDDLLRGWIAKMVFCGRTAKDVIKTSYSIVSRMEETQRLTFTREQLGMTAKG